MMKPYCSRIGRTWYSVRRSRKREQDLRAVERRDRDQVEDHQHDVDQDEQVQDLDEQIGPGTASSGSASR